MILKRSMPAAVSFWSGEETEKALGDLDRFVQLDPRNAAVLVERSIIHMKRGELELALADVDSAMTTACSVTSKRYCANAGVRPSLSFARHRVFPKTSVRPRTRGFRRSDSHRSRTTAGVC